MTTLGLEKKEKYPTNCDFHPKMSFLGSKRPYLPNISNHRKCAAMLIFANFLCSSGAAIASRIDIFQQDMFWGV